MGDKNIKTPSDDDWHPADIEIARHYYKDTLRDIVRSHEFSNSPMLPCSAIFGCSLTERRFIKTLKLSCQRNVFATLLFLS